MEALNHLSKMFLWLIAILCILAYVQFWLLPYLRNKIVFYFMSRKIRRMAKKHTGETNKALNEVADMIRDFAKNEKLHDDEE